MSHNTPYGSLANTLDTTTVEVDTTEGTGAWSDVTKNASSYTDIFTEQFASELGLTNCQEDKNGGKGCVVGCTCNAAKGWYPTAAQTGSTNYVKVKSKVRSYNYDANGTKLASAAPATCYHAASKCPDGYFYYETAPSDSSGYYKYTKHTSTKNYPNCYQISCGGYVDYADPRSGGEMNVTHYTVNDPDTYYTNKGLISGKDPIADEAGIKCYYPKWPTHVVYTVSRTRKGSAGKYTDYISGVNVKFYRGSEDVSDRFAEVTEGFGDDCQDFRWLDIDSGIGDGTSSDVSNGNIYSLSKPDGKNCYAGDITVEGSVEIDQTIYSQIVHNGPYGGWLEGGGVSSGASGVWAQEGGYLYKAYRTAGDQNKYQFYDISTFQRSNSLLSFEDIKVSASNTDTTKENSVRKSANITSYNKAFASVVDLRECPTSGGYTNKEDCESWNDDYHYCKEENGCYRVIRCDNSEGYFTSEKDCAFEHEGRACKFDEDTLCWTPIRGYFAVTLKSGFQDDYQATLYNLDTIDEVVLSKGETIEGLTSGRYQIRIEFRSPSGMHTEIGAMLITPLDPDGNGYCYVNGTEKTADYDRCSYYYTMNTDEVSLAKTCLAETQMNADICLVKNDVWFDNGIQYFIGFTGVVQWYEYDPDFPIALNPDGTPI